MNSLGIDLGLGLMLIAAAIAYGSNAVWDGCKRIARAISELTEYLKERDS